MPVNTAALKIFAPAMRRQLLEAVGRKLDLLLHSQTPDTLSTYAKQIADLREQEAQNREQLLERVAYTWFNRLCALRYLDARGWHPFGGKVLMPASEGETQPELLKLMRASSLPAELKPHTNEARLHGLLDGQIPPAMAGSDPQGEVYRELVLASCRSYHQLLPELFEGLDDASELLLPDDLLSEGSVAGGFRMAISDEDCADVEIIGWLYQFYISEKKDQVIGKVVNSEDIPAATQLFTPNWIVKYMVQNSLGATWLATYPDSPLKGQMEFYIEPTEQTPEVQVQLAAITPESLDPESLTLIDPACGSGHILVEAYDLLKAIYLERGYRQRDIPELILTKNLFGLDICPRAAQLAAFSLLMKGREDNRRLLERGIQLNVIALQDSTELSVERLAASTDLSAVGLNLSDLRMFADLFSHATTIGSLIKIPAFLAERLHALGQLTEQSSGDLLGRADIQLLSSLVQQASLLTRQYSTVATNPPYMGSGGMNPRLKEFAAEYYQSSKSDLFACFMDRGLSFAERSGYSAMVTMQSWMFLSSFEVLRRQIVTDKTISSLVHIGFNSFPSLNSKVALASAFVLLNTKIEGFLGSYIDLNREPQSADKCQAFLDKRIENKYVVNSEQFMKIPGSPISYSASDQMFHSFADYPALGSIAAPRKGMVTADNPRFIRCWHEVSWSNIGVDCNSREEAFASGRKWFPYCKGGAFRRWSGNFEYVVNWEKDGRELLGMKAEGYKVGSTNHNLGFIFKPAVTWTKICIDSAFRFTPKGFLYDDASGLCPAKKGFEWLVLALLNTPVASRLLNTLNPTLNLNPGNLCNIPVDTGLKDLVQVEQCVALSHEDWNAYERSWRFARLPVLDATNILARSLKSSYGDWISRNTDVVANMKRLEEENNRLFINAYGLHEELAPDFPTSKITLTVNPDFRYGESLNSEERLCRFQRDTMAELLSYAIGCMMGRYSLDQPGLILADSRESQTAQLAAYEAKVGRPLSEVQFKPDPDGIIPVLDGEWFEDDIVARTREFLAVTFPESSVAENLRFIEESLGKDIRKYFCSEFYKDHLQTYKKRPIYWMVQSPRKGFACLIYLHRYTKDTLNQVLNNYFRPYLQKLEARLAQLGLDQLNDDLPTRERTAARKEAEKITKVLKECQAWEQDALLPLAQQRIELDLDDGVKVNYLKLQVVLAPIPGLAAKDD